MMQAVEEGLAGVILRQDLLEEMLSDFKSSINSGKSTQVVINGVAAAIATNEVNAR